MKRLILIDGVNFFYRGAWSGAAVFTVRGEDMSYVMTYLRNLVSLMRHFGSEDKNYYAICWEGGYRERIRISSARSASGAYIPVCSAQP